jgi:glycosyltransferase involved in cell wall biosynthesis
MRLFIFESHPVQYHAPVYRELHRLCQQEGRSAIQVFYATDASVRGHFDEGFKATVAWDEPLLQGYPATVLNAENGVPLRGFNSLTGQGVAKLIKTGQPDAVLLTGLAYRFDWSAYLTALRHRIPIWIRTETQDEAFARSPMKSRLRWWLYRLAYAPVAKALVIGKLNAQHYQRLGLPVDRHCPSPYCVVDRFEQLTAEQRQGWRRKVRAEAGFGTSTTVILFCGKLQPKKNPGSLLEALKAMPPAERSRYGVLYVGSGELEVELRLMVQSLSGVRVFFAGFKNQRELVPYYLASEVLVLPSRQLGETWGLVVNEALLAGLRVIVSRHVGCHADFGWLPAVRVFDGSTPGLLEALRSQPPASAAAQSRDFLRWYSVEAAAAGIAEAMGLEVTSEATSPRIKRVAPGPVPVS